jgi:hypothetical protein
LLENVAAKNNTKQNKTKVEMDIIKWIEPGAGV